MKTAALSVEFSLDPLRTLEKCLLSSRDYKLILPVEAQYHYFECNSCRRKNVQGWIYRDQIDGEWKPFTVLHRCMDCVNGRQSKEIEKEIEMQRARRLMEEYWFIDPDLQQAGFKNYITDNPPRAKAKKVVMDYVKAGLSGNFEPLNLLLIGSFGTGKSHLATAAARTFRDSGLCTGFIMEELYISLIKSSFNGGKKTEAEIVDELSRFDCLVIDDIGSENYKMEESSWVSTRLLHLINARKGKPTIYTTNLNSENLPKAIGERAFSRLKVKTKIVDMFTDDYRDKFLC